MLKFVRHSGRVVTGLALAMALALPKSADAQTALGPDPGPAPSSRGASTEPVFRVLAPKQNELHITERFAKVVETKARISRVDGFDPAVIGVTALTPNQLRVQALGPGVTTMVIVDENNATWLVDVFVTGDVRHLQAYLSQLYPQSAVEAVAVRDAVVLRGWVTQPENITDMVMVAEQFYPRVLNQMRVGGVQQVVLKVRVMEVQRAKIRRLGLNFLYRNKNGYLVGTPGALVPLSTITTAVPQNGGPVPPTVDITQTALRTVTGAFGIVGDTNTFDQFIEALKSESLLKILAEPELTATNGRPANMLAGGEFPILVPQSLGTTTIQWREFGVRLEAVPLILGGGRVRLELQPEVSERDFTNAVQVNGFTVPGLTTRRVNTQVEMKFGETFMLAGLLSMRNTAQTDKVPFFGEIPWIGSAFRRVRYDEAETELVIMVTPELVAPLDPMTLPPGGPGLFTDTPLDRDLYRDGMIEVPKYGDECAGGNCRPGYGRAPHAINAPGAIGPGVVPPGSYGPPPGTMIGPAHEAGPRSRSVPPPPSTAPSGLLPPKELPSTVPEDPSIPPAPPSSRSDSGVERTGGVRSAQGSRSSGSVQQAVGRGAPRSRPKTRSTSSGLIEPK